MLAIKIQEDPKTDTGRDFYVSIISSCGRRHSLLLGPYGTHQEAKNNVERGREAAYRANEAQATWCSFGTCSMPEGTPAKTLFGQEAERND